MYLFNPTHAWDTDQLVLGHNVSEARTQLLYVWIITSLTEIPDTKFLELRNKFSSDSSSSLQLAKVK